MQAVDGSTPLTTQEHIPRSLDATILISIVLSVELLFLLLLIVVVAHGNAPLIQPLLLLPLLSNHPSALFPSHPYSHYPSQSLLLHIHSPPRAHHPDITSLILFKLSHLFSFWLGLTVFNP
jgi:hypothetical protein